MIVRAMPYEADLLLVNANVLTVDPAAWSWPTSASAPPRRPSTAAA
jgi:hypothetical protein